jgi:hypothetical protein
MIVLFKIDIRDPIGWVGSYNTAPKLGLDAKPNPATPWSAPFKIKNVPSGKEAMQGITRFEGLKKV